MRKLTLDHVSAICRAAGYIVPKIVPNMSPYHRKAIEDDLELLAEVKKFILDVIYEPGLLMGTFELKNKDLDGTENNNTGSG